MQQHHSWASHVWITNLGAARVSSSCPAMATGTSKDTAARDAVPWRHEKYAFFQSQFILPNL